MRTQMENPRAISDILASLTQPSNNMGRLGNDSFENIFMSTNNANAERQTQRQTVQTDSSQRSSSHNERPAQRVETNSRSEIESPRSQQDSERASSELSTAQANERPEIDAETGQGNNAEAVARDYEENSSQSQVTAGLAGLLGMEAAALEAIMQKLGFTYADLADPVNRTALLQTAFGLESEVQLLNIPDVAQMHQKIADLLAKHADSLPAAKIHEPAVTYEQVQVLKALPTAPQQAESEQVSQMPQPEAEPKQEAAVRGETGANLGQEARDHHEQLGHTAQAKPAEEPRLEVVQQSDGTFVVTETSTNQAARIISVSSRPASANINPQDIIRQLADNMRFDIRGSNVSEIRLTLRPENLGEVTMRIAAENGIVTASFVAENARVKEALEANMNQLRQALEEKGLEISQLTVSVESNADERMRQFLAEQARNSGRLREINQGLEAAEAEALEAEAAARLPHLDSTVEFSA